MSDTKLINFLAKGLNFSITSRTLPNNNIIATKQYVVKDLEKEQSGMICAKMVNTMVHIN